VFHQLTTTRGTDLRLQSLKTDHRGGPLLETRFDEAQGEVSPDGRWLAYVSNSSEAFEVYVRPFANADERQWQISTVGGTNPLWAPSGRELYYVAPDGTLMAVPVEPRNAVWRAGSPAKVVEGRYVVRIANSGRNYDVSPDGQRFLMLKQVGAAALPQLIVVQNWVEELKRLVPTK
jgi:Tol biopolymer transport system component